MSIKTPFWRFLPTQAMPDAASPAAAAQAGQGAFARTLREARATLGVSRTVALLRGLDREARIGRRFRLLLVSSFQPRAIEDALLVAFAIRGLKLETRSIDGFALLDSVEEAAFADVDMAYVPVLPAGTAALDLAGPVATLARRCAAPVLAATLGADGSTFAGTGATVVAIACKGPAIDARFGKTFGVIPTPEAADRLAEAAAGFAASIAGTAPKLIVTDLDGTLWQGTLGEDGVAGIELNRPYADALTRLSSGGLVLAIASRNDAADVEAAFAAHPEWPLARDDFAAAAIGWDDKDVLAASVLDRLNLGAEHMLAVDDDPVNCARLAERFPQADIRLFAADGDASAAILDDLAFHPSRSGGADRTEQYRRRAEVERLRTEAPSVAEFMRRLRTQLTVVPLNPSLLPRAAELASRVNQFAMNDRRPSVAELASRGSPLDFVVQLDDAFGAHGLVGLVLARPQGMDALLDGFFLSCRAFSRGVEAAMMLALRRLASAEGCHRIVGAIEHLPRNEPARRYFSAYLDTESGRSWTISVADGGEALEGVTIQWLTT